MKSYYLSKSEVTSLINQINKKWNLNIRTRKVLYIEVEKGCLLVSDEVKLVKINLEGECILLPFLADNELLKKFPSVEVDMGAIGPICNGASVLRPGIVKMDEFKINDVVTVKDVNYKKYIAVGIALMNSSDAINITKGSVIRNLHHISDKFWEVYKSLNIK